jgi:putative resolvase
MPTEYVNPKEATSILGVTHATLRNWVHKGQIDYIRTAGGQYRYNTTDYINSKKTQRCTYVPRRKSTVEKEAKGILYARVSSSKQKDDMQRQIEELQEHYPTYNVVRDICSGLKYKGILESAKNGNIQEVVAAH